VEALREKEKDGETQFTNKIDGFLSFTLLNANVFFLGSFLFEYHPQFMTKLKVLVLSFPLLCR
jgi:hypothetical protein